MTGRSRSFCSRAGALVTAHFTHSNTPNLGNDQLFAWRCCSTEIYPFPSSVTHLVIVFSTTSTSPCHRTRRSLHQLSDILFAYKYLSSKPRPSHLWLFLHSFPLNFVNSLLPAYICSTVPHSAFFVVSGACVMVERESVSSLNGIGASLVIFEFLLYTGRESNQTVFISLPSVFAHCLQILCMFSSTPNRCSSDVCLLKTLYQLVSQVLLPLLLFVCVFLFLMIDEVVLVTSRWVNHSKPKCILWQHRLVLSHIRSS